MIRVCWKGCGIGGPGGGEVEDERSSGGSGGGFGARRVPSDRAWGLQRSESRRIGRGEVEIQDKVEKIKGKKNHAQERD